jgi:beta-mannanase
MWFQGWENNGEFDEPRLDAVAKRGAMPMVTWEPWNHRRGVKQPKYALRKVAAGRHDAYIRRWARDAAAWNKPLYVRFAHEMNGNWYPWGANVNGNTKTDYKNAWRRVVRIFRQEGATKVRWVWSPSAEVLGNGVVFDEIYPGDDYVDWVALDGYNWGTTRSGSDWTSLAELFDPSYDALTAMTNKPVMIAETASAEAGGDKAAWIREGLLKDVPSRLPRVEAVIWFNTDKEANWRVDSSVRALEAYRDVATSPLYGGLP